MPTTDHITLAHGNGGLHMRRLIDEVFARHLANPELQTTLDAAPVTLGQGTPLVTTDGFTVQPLEFPGGSIGTLAVHGTCNDLAVAGADPHYLSLNAFIEEGLPLDLLDRIVADLAHAATAAGVRVVAGDTKVLRRGEGGGLYLATTGIGSRNPALVLGMEQVQPGDKLLVSGPVGDHGACVMLAREEFGLRGELVSDAADVQGLCRAAREIPGLRFMRDPTRGGLATVGHELARACQMTVRMSDAAIPVHDAVQSICEILGYDPLFLACEARVAAVAAPEAADTILAAWRALPDGGNAQLIGTIDTGPARLEIETELGGTRILEELRDDPLPRIC